MTERERTAASMILKSETEEIDSKDKDKDKLKYNDIKNIFNIVVNNYKDVNSTSLPKKKINKENIFHKISFKDYFNKVKKNYKIINSSRDKGNDLNKDNSNDNILTIISSGKIHTSLPHYYFIRNKDKIRIHKKKKAIKVDMYYSKKFRNIKPQKDFNFKKNNSTIFSCYNNDKDQSKSN